MKTIKILGSISLALASMWFGAYSMAMCPSWTHFPAYMTGVIGFCAGVGLTIRFAVEGT